jgi:hypothetical protein
MNPHTKAILSQIGAIRQYVISLENKFTFSELAMIETVMSKAILEIARESRKPANLDGALRRIDGDWS